MFLKYPNEVQNELLFHLLSKAKDTEIGKQYDFSSISNYRTFSERIPISSYEDYQGVIRAYGDTFTICEGIDENLSYYPNCKNKLFEVTIKGEDCRDFPNGQLFLISNGTYYDLGGV